MQLSMLWCHQCACHGVSYLRYAAFCLTTSPGPLMQGEDKLLGTSAKPFAPMEVIGEINDDGLGLTMWWATPADEDMAE